MGSSRISKTEIYQKIVEKLGEAIVLTDKNENVVYTNTHYCQLTGYCLEELISTPAWELWDEETKERIRYHNQLRKQGLSSSYEGTMLSKDRKKIPVLISGSPTGDGGTVGVIFNMSEHKRQELVYQMLLQHMNEGVVVTDKEGKAQFVNPKFCQLTGFTVDEIVGKSTLVCYDKESASKVEYVNEHERKMGISSSYECTMVSKSGRKVPVLISGSPLDDGGTIGIITDLTELQTRESMYKMLIENMNEAVWVGDSEERTLYVNPKGCQLLGYSLEEMLTRKSYDFWDNESAETVKRVNETDRKRGISSSYTGNCLTKKGELIPVLCTGTPLPEGGTFAIITDLRALKEQEKQSKILSAALEYTTDAVVTFDEQGHITAWNKGAKFMFGYKKNEILGKTLESIFDSSVTNELLNSCTIRYNFELSAMHRNKTPVRISATLTPISECAGKKACSFLMIARDITRHVKLEEEITLKYQKIKEAYNQFGILRRQMDYLFELVDLTGEHSDKKSIADFIVSSVIMLTKVDACVLRLYNPAKNTLDLLSSFGVDEDWRGKVSIRYVGSLAERAFVKKQPLRIIDLVKETKYQSPFLAKKMNLSSLLLIPLTYRGRFIGSLSLYANPDRKLEIFENEFIEKYSRLVEMVLGTVFMGDEERYPLKHVQEEKPRMKQWGPQAVKTNKIMLKKSPVLASTYSPRA